MAFHKQYDVGKNTCAHITPLTIYTVPIIMFNLANAPNLDITPSAMHYTVKLYTQFQFKC